MKTFNQFLESIDVSFGCTTYAEAEALAISWGICGAHEVNGVYYPGLTPMEFQRIQTYIRGKKMVGACESTMFSIDESVLRYTWEEVTVDDVDNYVTANKLKMVRDPKNKDLFTAVLKSNPSKVIFRYDVDDMNLYSDYTLIQLEDGKAK